MDMDKTLIKWENTVLESTPENMDGKGGSAQRESGPKGPASFEHSVIDPAIWWWPKKDWDDRIWLPLAHFSVQGQPEVLDPNKVSIQSVLILKISLSGIWREHLTFCPGPEWDRQWQELSPANFRCCIQGEGLVGMKYGQPLALDWWNHTESCTVVCKWQGRI